MGHDVAVKSSGTPAVRDWATGEEIVLTEASNDRLGEVIENTGLIRNQLSEVEHTVSDELIARLDRDMEWTWRGEGGLKISTSSPSKGTEDFPIDALEACLRGLVDAGTISADGAAKAIKRQVTVTVNVPLSVPMGGLIEEFGRWTVHMDGKPDMPVVKVERDVAKIAAGVARLRKIPAAAEALAKAAIEKDPPARRVKVERT